tara:strand:- start:890 stop:1381 length:492 start_codon:yes stop_codon:yes gene_type:complete
MITKERLHSLFTYIDGDLVNKTYRHSSSKIGYIAGATGAKGYIDVQIDGKPYKAHRLVYTMLKGDIPSGYQIDHIDGNRINNKIENLRLVRPAENNLNCKVRADNTSGVIGVCWSKRGNKWIAKINKDKKRIELGSFVSFDDAVNARKEAEIELGFHPNHGSR